MSNIRTIGIFGKQNVGKSSFINAISGQETAIVSSVAGTTNDPVRKRIEIPNVGPCVIVDTAGLDDSGELGSLRVNKSEKTIDEIDLALLLFAGDDFNRVERELLRKCAQKKLPFLIIHNQSDISEIDPELKRNLETEFKTSVIEFSCSLLDESKQLSMIAEVDRAIANKLSLLDSDATIMHGLVKKGKKYILVAPQDNEAPKGRLILPQVMAIRDVIDNHGIAIVLQPDELSEYLKSDTDIAMIVTDSSVFKEVAAILEKCQYSNGKAVNNIPLTSFSILLSMLNANFNKLVEGAHIIKTLKKGSNVLILESCSHHISCNDIARVKLPAMLPDGINFTFVQGLDNIPLDTKFDLAIQCGGCMVSKIQLKNRMDKIIAAGIPITNFGMAIAEVNGILESIHNIKF